MTRWLCVGVLFALPAQAAVDEACVDRCVADGSRPEHCAKDCAIPDMTAPVPPAATPILPPLPVPEPAAVPVPPPPNDVPATAGSADATAPTPRVPPSTPQGSARPADSSRVTISEAVKLGRDATAPELYRDLSTAMSRRANAFPNFERVITGSAVEITPAMIESIARNEYAADIVYYLTWNEPRAQRIAALPVDAVPAAILDLEQRLKPRSTK